LLEQKEEQFNQSLLRVYRVMSFLVPFVLFCRSVIPRREIVVLP
jgi:hypothetical protein